MAFVLEPENDLGFGDVFEEELPSTGAELNLEGWEHATAHISLGDNSSLHAVSKVWLKVF